MSDLAPAARAFGRARGLALVLAGVLAGVGWADRPAAVDNSATPYFPPIGRQELGDCTCWSSCYYYNTYTQARDAGVVASGGDPNVVCSPRFLFPLIAQGSWGAECTEHAMARLSDVGCAPVSVHPMDAWYTDWPTEAAWVAALRNRTGPLHKVRVDNEAGLAIVKQHMATGGIAVTRADFLSNYGDYGATATGPGISNRVMYRRQGWHYLRHSICLVGYDDDRAYVDDRDGQVHHGAFLLANSEGADWGWTNSTGTGTKGFIWIAYTMFLEGECGWYDYDLDVSPCFDNAPYPEVYFHDDRPDYRPRLYAVAGINHNARNLLTYSGGIGSTAAPEFIGPEAIECTDEGAILINRNRRVAVDLTDGADWIEPGTTKEVFISLAVDTSASLSAAISSVDFYHDLDGNGEYTQVTAPLGGMFGVAPGTTGYITASITAPPPGDLDGDLDVDGEDFDIFADCLAGPGVEMGPECRAADLESDVDVDLADFSAFQPEFSGSAP